MIEGKSFFELSETEQKKVNEQLTPYAITFDKLMQIEKEIHAIVQLSLTRTEFSDPRLKLDNRKASMSTFSLFYFWRIWITHRWD